MTTIACTLEADDRNARRERWLSLGSHALLAVGTIPRGLELVFSPEPGVEREVAELAELERECCSFATWIVRNHGGRIVLDVESASDDAVPAVQGMFAALRELLAAPDS